MTIKDIAQKCNCSTTWVYKVAKQLGRLPTVDDIMERKGKVGRKPKYYNEKEN